MRDVKPQIGEKAQHGYGPPLEIVEVEEITPRPKFFWYVALRATNGPMWRWIQRVQPGHLEFDEDGEKFNISSPDKPYWRVYSA